ncbi:response regulator [Pseudoalteromonas shioyasakiensis]|uniref:Response regulator transcription factor n=1 Tax=Pseudoalteromonas shioyasakiensis TaxID=1190813 RepID=A0ABT6U3Y2_9GAMM|nr:MULTISPECIES: response regulator transcription factor [Pseudoalteromonas]MCO6353986.1 response regulator [Pseudoalteromonas shioyasakiensis]MDI4669803.1 response regulator transcription factor [Pseudoalteromonas shioyasakiensis]MDI4674612.1 response regulator transcription factor [Pseudoalteromonas shioyasakiensis]MDI4686718.1 response regulator transcription factor [Pseudoalteromonas shioyasakiensis]MDI4705313.1 response regulator transcription factor [Pseudoalteromonas shioyasakiensis]|tara:strand:+ start:943 stop:1617 length:675 start_codon:yes stop_codon:yes gene_type:complete
MKLLIIEDSVSLRRSLRIGLENLGFTIDETGDGAEGLSMAMTGEYELIILDIMLPSIDGITLLQTIRAKQLDVRVLILSAKQEPEDRVKGLLTGADDYLTKPFSFDELHARLLNLMRRGGLKTISDVIRIDNLALNLQLKLLQVNDTVIDFTPNEYKIVECLFSNQNKVITAEKLSTYIAGQYDLVSKNSIEAHLSSARKKVRAAGGELPIQTKRGFGYIIQGK